MRNLFLNSLNLYPVLYPDILLFKCKYLSFFFIAKYLFHELLELVDLDFQPNKDPNSCPVFHLMPRFVRKLPGKLINICNICFARSDIITHLILPTDIFELTY